MDRELIGWGLGGRPVLLPCDDDGNTKNSDERCLVESLRVVSTFHSRAMHRVSIFAHFCPRVGNLCQK